MSEDEFEEEDANDSHNATARGAPDEMYEEGMKREEEKEEDSPAAALKSEEEEDKSRQIEEEELKEDMETDSRSAAAPNEWEHFDAVSIFDASASSTFENSDTKSIKLSYTPSDFPFVFQQDGCDRTVDIT